MRNWNIVYIYINYSNTTKNNILLIDVSASRRKPSSGLTSGAGRQYVKACPIRGSTGSCPRLNSCCWSSWSISPALWVCQLCLILDVIDWANAKVIQSVGTHAWLHAVCCRPQQRDCVTYVHSVLGTAQFPFVWNDHPSEMRDGDISRIEFLKAWLFGGA